MVPHIKVLRKVKKYLSHKVKLSPLGHYKSFNDEDLWLKMVIEFCVMGGSRMIENLINDSPRYSKFANEIGLHKLLSIKKPERIGHINNTLKTFKATRFHSLQAKKLCGLLNNSKVILAERVVLLDGLSHTLPFRAHFWRKIHILNLKVRQIL